MTASITRIVDYTPRPLDLIAVLEKNARYQQAQYFGFIRFWLSVWGVK